MIYLGIDMTPKEKAKALAKKFWMDTDISSIGTAKKCALIAVDEIIQECDKFFEAISVDRKLYWFEVKQEIQKL